MKAKVYPIDDNTKLETIHASASSFCSLIEIIAASLAKGQTRIRNIAKSDEIDVALKWIKSYGASYKYTKTSLIITGVEGKIELKESLLSCPTSRVAKLFIPILSLAGKPFGIQGHRGVIARLEKYEKIYSDFGMTVYFENNVVRFEKSIKPTVTSIDGDTDISVVAGLMIALPLLYNDSKLRLIAPIRKEKSYKTILKILKRFRVDVKHPSTMGYDIDGEQHYYPCIITTESDEMMLSSLFLMATKLKDGAMPIRIENYYKNSEECSKLFEYVKKNVVSFKRNRISPRKKQTKIGEMELTLENTLPFFMIFATTQNLENKISHVDFSKGRVKFQYQRMESVFMKLNLSCDYLDNEVLVQPKKVTKKVQVDCQNDPYIAIALSILATLSDAPIVIKNAQCVYNINSNFFELLRSIGIKVDIIDDN